MHLKIVPLIIKMKTEFVKSFNFDANDGDSMEIIACRNDLEQ